MKVHTNSLSPPTLLLRSSEALTLSSRAFFNPGMLAMLYFPVEHKYAVYTPLFAPVSVPILVATIKEFRAWRKERRKKSAEGPKQETTKTD
jgi:GPI-anchor transamidase subunit S